MSSLPEGDVTFLFTDIEGSTRMLHRLGDSFLDVLEDHRRILRDAFAAHDGIELRTEGDSFFAVFGSVSAAVRSAVDAQRALMAHPWPSGEQVRVRMGLHTGPALVSGGDYVGLAVHEAARIAAAAHGGQVLVSETARLIAQSELSNGISMRDLGEHLLKDFDRPTRLFQVRHADLLDGFPPLRTLGARPNNLPVHLTSFVGREADIAELKAALASSRLVSIVGPGGAGKTRLAIEVAAEVLDSYPDGSWFIDLTTLVEASQLPVAIAAAIGEREDLGLSAFETVVRGLIGKRVLLILDNCEHLVGPAANVAGSLLARLPDLSVIATTQAPLHVTGETMWRAGSMSLPHLEELPPLDPLSRYDAIKLFVDRAQKRRHDFTLTNDNAASVAQICVGLDGIPLAIELAAARITMLQPAQIAERMDRRFGLLTGGSRQAPDRQRTLRSAVEWSCDLLAPAERDLLARLSVFRGGFTLDAAEETCGEGGDIFGSLSQLVDRSLVAVDFGGPEPRYRLLETIRQYGHERLVEQDLVEQVRDAHMRWMLRLLVRNEEEFTGPGQGAWLDRLSIELENIREALARAIGTSPDDAAEMYASVWRFWTVRGSPSEGFAWGHEVSALDVTDPHRRRRMLEAYANLANRQGAFPQAREAVEEAYKISLASGDPASIASTLSNMASAANNAGDLETAVRYYMDALTIRRDLGDKSALARVLANLGLVQLARGEYGPAEERFREALALCEEKGDLTGIIACSVNLATVSVDLGRLDDAEAFCRRIFVLAEQLGDRMSPINAWAILGRVLAERGEREEAVSSLRRSVSLAKGYGDPRRIAYATFALADVLHRAGEIPEARALLAEVLLIRRALGDRLVMARTVEAGARMWVSLGQHERGVVAMSAAQRQLEETGGSLVPYVVRRNEQARAEAKAALGDDAFEAAWDRGRRTSLGEAVDLVLEGLSYAA